MLTQFFLAGLGLFGAASLDPHRILGNLLILVALILLLLALASGRARGVTAILLLFTFIQMVLVWFSDGAPVVAALHPLNSLVLLSLGHAVASGKSFAELVPGRASSSTGAPAPRVQ